MQHGIATAADEKHCDTTVKPPKIPKNIAQKRLLKLTNEQLYAHFIKYIHLCFKTYYYEYNH